MLPGLLAGLALALLPGCALPLAPALTVAHALGTVQCEPGGLTPAALADRLRHAGIEVQDVACGHDGRRRPQACGTADGRLAVLTIPAAQQAEAQALGFRPLDDWPEARRQACPAPP